MKLGIFYATTDYAPAPHEVARACEERGFESLWVPEHRHIPTSRQSPFPGGGELPREYSHLHDPFVVLGAAAAVTRELKLCTAITLVTEHDPIGMAKQVATLDHISGGRVILGVGAGWNREEMQNHGTDPERRWKTLRERVEAMKAIWTHDEASYAGELVRFEPIWSWPKPVQRPHPPIYLGSATRGGRRRVVRYCDGWLPMDNPRLEAQIAELHELAREAGRDPASIGVTACWARAKRDNLERLRALGVERAVLVAPAAPMDALLPRLDYLAELQRALGGA